MLCLNPNLTSCPRRRYLGPKYHGEVCGACPWLRLSQADREFLARAARRGQAEPKYV